MEKSTKRQGPWYSSELKDDAQVEDLRQDTGSGIKQINNTTLPGKLNL